MILTLQWWASAYVIILAAAENKAHPPANLWTNGHVLRRFRSL